MKDDFKIPITTLPVVLHKPRVWIAFASTLHFCVNLIGFPNNHISVLSMRIKHKRCVSVCTAETDGITALKLSAFTQAKTVSETRLSVKIFGNYLLSAHKSKPSTSSCSFIHLDRMIFLVGFPPLRNAIINQELGKRNIAVHVRVNRGKPSNTAQTSSIVANFGIK